MKTWVFAKKAKGFTSSVKAAAVFKGIFLSTLQAG
jgi:hypothetical protein